LATRKPAMVKARTTAIGAMRRSGIRQRPGATSPVCLVAITEERAVECPGAVG
jgi:hypothetical protein